MINIMINLENSDVITGVKEGHPNEQDAIEVLKSIFGEKYREGIVS